LSFVIKCLKTMGEKWVCRVLNGSMNDISEFGGSTSRVYRNRRYSLALPMSSVLLLLAALLMNVRNELIILRVKMFLIGIKFWSWAGTCTKFF
jgi:hypothetical protein